MYRLAIYGEDTILMEIDATFDTLEEAEDAKNGIWVEIIEEEE